MNVKIPLLAAMMLNATGADASSNAAFAKLNLEVAQRCGDASKLTGAHISEVVGFDDTLGKVATLVTGRDRVKTRSGRQLVPVRKLCIYDKRSKRVWIDEAPGWNAPDLR